MRLRIRNAFTLIEMLLVLAFIGLITSLVVINTDSMFSGFGTPECIQTFRKSLREARFQALSTKTETLLSFNHEEAAFIVTDLTGHITRSFATDYDPDTLKVRFLSLIPDEGDTPKQTRQTGDSFITIHFYPDRSCTPFALELTEDHYVNVHFFDAFSDLELNTAD
jgi:prepilin-type N-terminal cleavage/methylation domain-containing protein